MMSFKFFSKNNRPEFWKVGNGALIPIKQIGTSHVHNIIECLNDRGQVRIPDIYEGFTKDEWIKIFRSELDRRELLQANS